MLSNLLNLFISDLKKITFGENKSYLNLEVNQEKQNRARISVTKGFM